MDDMSSWDKNVIMHDWVGYRTESYERGMSSTINMLKGKIVCHFKEAHSSINYTETGGLVFRSMDSTQTESQYRDVTSGIAKCCSGHIFPRDLG